MSTRCYKCGTALEDTAQAGLCARCLQKLAHAGWAVEPPDHRAPPPGEVDPPLRLGDYELGEEIGQGGMGVVYRARHVSLDRWVALKTLQAGRMASPEAARRFQVEALAAAKLDHPNIVPLYETGQFEGRCFYTMKLVRGRSLAAALAHPEAAGLLDQTGRRYDAEWNQWAVRLLGKIARAVHYAHQRGVLHRDLKPANILLDETGTPHVADFGLAKLLDTDDSLTRTEAVIGSPAYMAPEQAGGHTRDSTTAADIYSLGAIFYELLTGHPPFHSAHVTETLRLVATTDPPRPSLLRPNLDPDLETICLKCLEKEPPRRYSSAEALAEDLERWQRREPILARPATVRTRVTKWMRRNPAIATLVVALHGVAAAGLAGVLWGWAEAHRNALQELEQRRAAEANAYAADMNLAQQALTQDNLGLAQELLDRHRPPPVSEHGPRAAWRDLRGWEWRYLWSQSRSEAAFVLARLRNRIHSLSVSPEGRWLAVGEWDQGRLSVWNMDTRQKFLELVAGDGRIQAVFSPRAPLLAFSYVVGAHAPVRRHGIRLFHLGERRVVADLALGGECRGLTFSHDGELLAACSLDPANELTLWRVSDQARVASHPVSPGFFVAGNPLVLTPDRSLAVYGAADGWLAAVDLATGQERWREKAAVEVVATLALSPDGRTLVSGASGAESAICVWDALSGRALARLEGHRAWVGAIVFWPDGQTMASASADQTLRIWDLSDLAQVPPPRTLLGHALEVWSLVLLPEGRTLVSGSKDGAVYGWDVSNDRRVPAATTLPDWVVTWGFTPDSQSVITLMRDGRVVRWDSRNLTESQLLMHVGPNRVKARFCRETRFLAVGSAGGDVEIWDVAQAARHRKLRVADGLVRPQAFDPRARHLLVEQPDAHRLHQYEIATGVRRGSWPCPEGLERVVLSPDGRWCLLLGPAASCVLRNLATGAERRLLGLSTPEEAAFTPNGELFAVADDLGLARLWETATGRELATVRGFRLGVHSVGFTPDGRRLVIGSSGEEAIRLWSLESRRGLLTLPGQASRFWQPAVSRDGNLLGAFNGVGVLHLWRAPSWEEIAAAEARAP